MLKAIIVDDEKPAIKLLNVLLKKTKEIEVAGSFLDGADALAAIRGERPDVVFLDIEMPGMNGIELAEAILAIDSDVEVVFVTAFERYALEAFKINALSYLLKPISYDDVAATVARLNKIIGRKSDSGRKDSVSGRGEDLDSGGKGSDSGRIYCFGEFSVYGKQSQMPVSWRTSKAEEFFAYMLQNPKKKVTKSEICDVLWPDYDYAFDQSKIDNHLHPTVYKTKQVLTGAGIDFELSFVNGSYWMSLANAYIDTRDFDKQIDMLPALTESTVDEYHKLMSLYRGDYLADHNYLWALAEQESYLRKYYNVAISLAKFYMKAEKYTDAEKVLLNVLERSSLDEDAHELLLKCYHARGDRAAFFKHYKAVKELFKKELGIKPSDAIQALINGDGSSG